ncbi:hypothetical protein FXF51_35890 [Nonomuraea sp. PA05]|uniref:hypothetical protein n=1 Tax=Nonomuraea sp. PA05 TaxID=2604466 RepID=UPI0011D829FC|nr:hypothetical protein [Nonomuraea sp. PA05]TYB58910.1 hypothetical protein FXF51_35890 [Nonomuraea sp. PA05]
MPAAGLRPQEHHLGRFLALVDELDMGAGVGERFRPPARSTSDARSVAVKQRCSNPMATRAAAQFRRQVIVAGVGPFANGAADA